MPINLTDTQISDTYGQLLHVSDGPTATAKTVYSGTGTATALKVATTHAEVDSIRLDGTTISTTTTNGDLNLSPNGTGAVVIGNAEITGGTISNVTLSGSTLSSITGGTITGATISGGSLSGTTVTTGTFSSNANESLMRIVRKASAGTITKGQAVYVVGSTGTHLTVELADASVEATAATTIGVAAESITNSADGYMMVSGLLTGLSTLPTASFTNGAMLWLSETTGALTTTRPTQPAHGVFMGWVVNASNGASGSAYIKVINGQELDELHDVLITSPATDHILVYDGTVSPPLWKNVAGSSKFLPLAGGTLSGELTVAKSSAGGVTIAPTGYNNALLSMTAPTTNVGMVYHYTNTGLRGTVGWHGPNDWYEIRLHDSAGANSRLSAKYVYNAQVALYYGATECFATTATGVAVTGGLTATTSILSSGATSGVGYSTGAGGTVTQLTNRDTPVTLNKTTGAITLVSGTTTAPTYNNFTVNNSTVAATDVVIVNFKSGASASSYNLCVTAVAAGSFRIQIQNLAAVAVAEAPVINFAVIKGVAA